MAGSKEDSYNQDRKLSSILAGLEGPSVNATGSILFSSGLLPIRKGELAPLDRKELQGRCIDLAIAAHWGNKAWFERILEETFPQQLSNDKKDQLFSKVSLIYQKELSQSIEFHCAVSASEGNSRGMGFFLTELHASFARRVKLGDRDDEGNLLTTSELQREALISACKGMNDSMGRPDIISRKKLLRAALDNPNYSPNAVHGAAAELGIDLRQ